MNRTQKKVRRITKRSIQFVLLMILVFIINLPIIYMVLNSFKSNAELTSSEMTFFPKNFTWENFQYVFMYSDVPRYFLNSVIITFSSCLIAIVVAACAGYVLSRFENRGTSAYGKLLLILQIFPMILVLIPLFVLFTRAGLINTRISLIILYTAICLPYSVWMFKSYFDSIGKEMEEAAWIDGCTRAQSFRKVVIPLTWPGVVAVTIYAFVLCWNEFMLANSFLRTDEIKTMPVAIRSFIMLDTTNWGYMMATATVALLPVFLLFLFFQKYMIAGYTDGGTKE